MRLLVVGRLSGQLGAAVRMAIAAGAKVSHVESASAATAALRAGQGADLMMVDYDLDIASLIAANAAERITVPVVACGIAVDPRRAADAIRAGAKEFIPLPPEAELIAAVLNAVTSDHRPLVTRDPSMLAVMKLADQIAPSDASVLITGESGVGKEVMARHVHARSKRADRALHLRQLRGHPGQSAGKRAVRAEKGAFTGAHARRIGKFEEADGGTLLLDEITEMDAGCSPKLLRAIKSGDRPGGRLQARAGQHPNPGDEQSRPRTGGAGRRVPRGPALPAERREPGGAATARPARRTSWRWAEHFAKKFAAANELPERAAGARDARAPGGHSWPGNVRELENALHRAVLIASGPEIGPEAILLPEVPAGAADPAADAARAAEAVTRGFVGRTVAAVEQQLILDTLGHCLGNRTHAANILGISIRTLRNKLNEYAEAGVTVPPPQSGLAPPKPPERSRRWNAGA
jgi:DNA-binding NtrC family response regulator